MTERQRDGAVGAALFLTVIVTLANSTAHPARTTMILSGTAALTVLAWRQRQDLVLGVTGLVVGPLIEWAATSCGLWQYAVPSIAGLPLWVWPMWWIYPVTVARLIVVATGQAPRPSLTFAVMLIVVEVPWLCALGLRQPVMALAGTLALLAVFLSRHHRRVDLVTLLICGAIGPAAELWPVWSGAWSYESGPLFGLPIWLPVGYGVFGAALIHVGLALAHRRGAQSCPPLEQPVHSLRQLDNAEPE